MRLAKSACDVCNVWVRRNGKRRNGKRRNGKRIFLFLSVAILLGLTKAITYVEAHPYDPIGFPVGNVSFGVASWVHGKGIVERKTSNVYLTDGTCVETRSVRFAWFEFVKY